MHFKLDENLPQDLADFLSVHGHEVETVASERMSGCTDAGLAETCVREGRVLISFDLDFADIRKYPPPQLPGILVLRLERQDTAALLDTFRELLPLINTEPITGQLWIVEKHRIRIRGGR